MLLTRAEATGYRETSLHADVMRFVAGLDALGDPRLHVTNFGHSPGGRELPLLILSKDGLRSPAEARRSARPVVLMQDGIHPGEVEGKEASLALVRDLLAGQHPPGSRRSSCSSSPSSTPTATTPSTPPTAASTSRSCTASPGRWSAPAPRATAST
jgi:hypothetical protein